MWWHSSFIETTVTEVRGSAATEKFESTINVSGKNLYCRGSEATEKFESKMSEKN